MAISVVTPHSVVDLGLLNGMPGINVVAGSHDKRPQNPQLIQGITPDALIQILSLLNIAKPNPGIPGKNMKEIRMEQVKKFKKYMKKFEKLKNGRSPEILKNQEIRYSEDRYLSIEVLRT